MVFVEAKNYQRFKIVRTDANIFFENIMMVFYDQSYGLPFVDFEPMLFKSKFAINGVVADVRSHYVVSSVRFHETYVMQVC